MEDLKLKHLAPYLPYKLRFRSFLSKDESTYALTSGNLNNFEYGSIRIIPILRPFSDLTKEIEVNGEKFSPYDWFEQHEDNDYFADNIWMQYLFNYEKDDIVELDLIPYGVMEKLFEWHFDVFGLIEKGLAISYNDL